ncbi:MAG: hypothetical protein MI723_18395, partial [Caulobacterales bacterium]|nr:hypothetical protein [Caulobacterales bacterium]
MSHASADLPGFIDRCREVLAEGRARLAKEPDANPVRDLAYDVSRRLESGAISGDEVAGAAKIVCDAAFRRRADRLARYAPPVDLGAALSAAADEAAGDGFAALLSRPAAGIVFTAHPTFALSREMRAILAALADDPDDADAGARLSATGHGPDPDITIEAEHAETQAAIARAQGALRAANRAALGVLKARDPQGWTSVTPRLASVASWVGYDFDGRTDIHWSDTFRLRIEEKALLLRV